MSDIVPIKGNVALAGLNERLNKMASAMVTPSAVTVFPRISTNKSRFSITRSGEDPVYIKSGSNYVSELPVVILSANPGVYKTFYEKEYVPGTDPEAPACWSNSGDVPHPSSPKKQAKSCAECPMNVFGSKITATGAKAKRCSDSKRLLVVSPKDIAGEIYMLNVSATALKTWNTYIKMLTRGGVHPQTVTTTLSFEEDVDYPKLTFQYAGTLDAAQIGAVVARLDEPEVEEFSAGAADTETDFERTADNEPVPPKAEKAPKTAKKEVENEPSDAAANPFGGEEEPAAEAPKGDAVDDEVKSLLGF